MSVRSILSFAWIEFRALKYYPSNLILEIVKGYITIFVWFFIAYFIQGFSSGAFKEFGGNYVSYVVLGVIFFQSSQTFLLAPFKGLSTAFWEKRLEIYATPSNGVQNYIYGEMLWNFILKSFTTLLFFFTFIFIVKVDMTFPNSYLNLTVVYLLLSTFAFGFGMIGASNFFFLEVKQGREPLTWTLGVLTQLFSGLYYPISLFPKGVRWISYALPQSYAFDAIRRISINGTGLGERHVLVDVAMLSAFTVAAVLFGKWLFKRSIARAEKTTGFSSLV
jgi:ABC-2 type transport system permease protein